MADDKKITIPSGEMAKQIGRYVILNKLGEGKMGKVYKAYDTSLERLVSLKLLSSEAGSDDKVVQRFTQEAKATARLSHPHIVALHDFEEIGKIRFLTMDFIHGCSLERFIQKQQLSFSRACKWMLKILDAIGYAHEQGIIHRDLKPSNILISKAGQPFVTDFGLAKAITNDTKISHIGAVIGTPAYMPPEQARANPDDPVDHRSDIYSLGAIFYEMLAGNAPWEGDNVLAMLYKVVNDEVKSPRKINPNIPVTLERICLKALSKNKADRYQSAKEMANEIAQYLKAEDRELARRSLLTSTWEFWQQRPRLTVVVTLLLCAGLATGIYWLTHRPGHVPVQPITDANRSGNDISPNHSIPNLTGEAAQLRLKREQAAKEALLKGMSYLKNAEIEEFLAICSPEYLEEDLPPSPARDNMLKIWGMLMHYTVIDSDNAKTYSQNDTRVQINIFWGFKVERNIAGKEDTHFMIQEHGHWQYDGDKLSNLVRKKNLRMLQPTEASTQVQTVWKELIEACRRGQQDIYEQLCSRDLKEDAKTKEEIWKLLTTTLKQRTILQQQIAATTDPNLLVILLQFDGLQRDVKVVLTREGNHWKLCEMRPFAW